MFDPEFVKQRRLSAAEAGDLVRDAVVRRDPFSFVRMNDGEAVILGAYKEFAEEHVQRITTHWWGRADYTRDEVMALRETLLEAAASADLFGAFDSIDPHGSRWTMAGQLTRRYAKLSESQRFCWPEVHYTWQTEDRFSELFGSIEDVVYISNFDVTEGMKEKFGFKSVRRIAIPAHATAGAEKLVGKPQYPERFLEVIEELKGVRPGDVVLVGAGVAGKYYCHTVKQAGGVALDIGSVFDFWSGNRKRRSVRKHASRVGF